MLNFENDATLGYFLCFVIVSGGFEDQRDTGKCRVAKRVVKGPLGDNQQPITYLISKRLEASDCLILEVKDEVNAKSAIISLNSTENISD